MFEKCACVRKIVIERLMWLKLPYIFIVWCQHIVFILVWHVVVLLYALNTHTSYTRLSYILIGSSPYVGPPLLNFSIWPLSEFPDYKSLSDICVSVSAGEREISQATYTQREGPDPQQDRSVCKTPTLTPEDYHG